jgi:hypothetical protein
VALGWGEAISSKNDYRKSAGGYTQELKSDYQQVLPKLTQAIKTSSILAERPLPEPVVPLLDQQSLDIPSSIITQDYLWPVCLMAPIRVY